MSSSVFSSFHHHQPTSAFYKSFFEVLTIHYAHLFLHLLLFFCFFSTHMYVSTKYLQLRVHENLLMESGRNPYYERWGSTDGGGGRSEVPRSHVQGAERG